MKYLHEKHNTFKLMIQFDYKTTQLLEEDLCEIFNRAYKRGFEVVTFMPKGVVYKLITETQ